MKFELDTYVLNFKDPAQYPASRPMQKVQAVDRKANGELEVESFDFSIQSRVLVFEDMSEEDYIALWDWYDNIANGAANTFKFTDEYGDQFDVRIVDDFFNFRETSLKLYSGTMTLEIVQ